MCFIIAGKRTKAHAKFKNRRVAYKIVETTRYPIDEADSRSYRNVFGHRGVQEYTLGVPVTSQLFPKHVATIDGRTGNSAAGFYVYRTLAHALRLTGGFRLKVIAVKVRPSDLLHVDKIGSIATYSGLTPLCEYDRHGHIVRRA